MKRIWSLQTLQLKKITAANVEAVCNAAVAVTNGYKVIQCREKNLITFEQVEALLGNGNPAFMCAVACNAFDSSNDIIRASAYSKLEELALTSADHDYEAIGWLSWLGCEFHYSKARLTSTKKLVAAGKLDEAGAKVAKMALGVACDGIDYVFVKYPKAKDVKELVSASTTGFVGGFKSVVTLAAGAEKPAIDEEAYKYLKSRMAK